MKRSRRRATLRRLRLVTRLVYDPAGHQRLLEQHSTASAITESQSPFNEELTEDNHIADKVRPDRGNVT